MGDTATAESNSVPSDAYLRYGTSLGEKRTVTDP